MMPWILKLISPWRMAASRQHLWALSYHRFQFLAMQPGYSHGWKTKLWTNTSGWEAAESRRVVSLLSHTSHSHGEDWTPVPGQPLTPSCEGPSAWLTASCDARTSGKTSLSQYLLKARWLSVLIVSAWHSHSSTCFGVKHTSLVLHVCSYKG